MLAVLPLVAFDALLDKGLKSVYYADDGLGPFFGNVPGDFPSMAEGALVSSNIGAKFGWRKCGWVKKDGKWLKPLKFVGLVYDPFADLLSASTRNGATLPMFIGKAKQILQWVCPRMLP